MRNAFTLFCCLLCLHAFPQDKVQRLIVAEYRKFHKDLNNYTYLTSYNFQNGRFISKDTLLGIDNNTKDKYIGIYHGLNGLIYQNRYYIPHTGSVFDLKQRKIITNQYKDQYVETLGDTVIFYRDNIYTGKGHLALDLRTGEYNFIEEKSWYQKRYPHESPDRNHYLSIEGKLHGTTENRRYIFQVYLHDKHGNKTLVVEDAGVGPYISAGPYQPSIETHWLNNHSFLYVVHHHKKDEQKKIYHQVDLRKYDLRDHADEIFFTLDSIYPWIFNGQFTQDGINQTIYKSTNNAYYLLDTINNRLIDHTVHQIGNDFSYSSVPDEGRTTIIQFQGNPIGTLSCLVPRTTQNAAAVEYGDTGTNLGYPKGIKIWTAQQKGWLTFDLPQLNTIIGWVEEEKND